MIARTRNLRATLIVAVVMAIAAVTAGSAQAAAPGRQLGVRPAIPHGANSLGALSGSAQIQATLALTPQDPAQLAAYAQAVSTPGSPSYHDYLSVAQFAQRFGASPNEIAAVRSSLAARGLSVGSVGANGLSVEVSGSAARLGSAFSTSFQRYRLATGSTAFANNSAPVATSSLDGRVQAIFGLDSLPQLHAEGLEHAHATGAATASASAASTGPAPCTAATQDAGVYGAFTADQIASTYGYPSLYGQGDTGSGASVALFELEPFSTSDISAYQSCYGTSASVTKTTVDGGAGSGSGSGEAALDIEDVIGLAPAASIDVYEGPNTSAGVFDTYQQIVSNDTQKVISTSWGLCEAQEGSAAAASENTLFQEAAVQGQSIFAAAGDSGADDCASKSYGAAVDDPASQPYVTGVGGTTLSLSPSRTETVWNDGSGQGAGGGGVSKLWAQPSYQTGRVLSQSSISCGSGGTTCREVPDVSADADENTGYVIYWKGNWTAIGGTSAATPTWAALAALADASPACAGGTVGFLNPGLYAAGAGDFNDITSGNNSYGGVTGYPALTGYDMASGLGTPVAASLAPALCGDHVSVSSPGAQTTVAGTPLRLALTAISTAGKAITFSASGLPAGLAINAGTGVISGTPTTPGSSNVLVTATDSGGVSGDASFTWTVTGSPQAPEVSLVTPAPGPGQVGVAARLPVQASDSDGYALSYSATGLPSGLSINRSSGVISGIPKRAGTSTVHLAVSDGHGGSATAAFSWTIAPAPRVTHAKLKPTGRHRATLTLSVSTGSSQIALTQVGISKPGSATRLSLGRTALAGMAKAVARSAKAVSAKAKLTGGGGGLTVSVVSARRGSATLSVPLKLQSSLKRGSRLRVKVAIADAAGARRTVTLRLAL